MEIQFCPYCGGAHQDLTVWPRVCSSCGREHYRNPVPVSVVVVPVEDGVLLVRRAIPPAAGKLALPGGFVDWAETWQQAGAREVREETGLVLSPDELRLIRVDSVPGGILLLFSQAAPRTAAELQQQLQLDEKEISEALVTEEPVELAFPTHTQVLADFLGRRRRDPVS